MKQFSIWFDQVNQTRYEIEANTRKQAISKAMRTWNAENKNPYPSEVLEHTVSP